MKPLTWIGEKVVRVAAAEDGGAFLLASPDDGRPLRVIASNGLGWDHVSVSRADRIPTWTEMDFVRRTFFHRDEWVMQLHPPDDSKINIHANCLHLWRPHDKAIPKPPTVLV